jgi:hypothetical protein
MKTPFKSRVVARLTFSYASLAEDGKAHIEALMSEVRREMGETRERMKAFGITFAAETDHMVTYETAGDHDA